MSDIFLSYAREDLAKAEKLARRLTQQGWSVFWDLTIPPGKTWRQMLDDELRLARCIVVAWSRASIQSEWVLEEADEGKQRKILIPVLFEAVRPPLGFRSIQAVNLADWNGETAALVFQRLLKATADLLGPPGQPQPAAEYPPTDSVLKTASVYPHGGRVRVRKPVKAPNPQPEAKPSIILPTRKPLEIFRDPLKDGSLGPEMIIIPAGSFRMGDINGQGSADERPVHTVSIAEPFGIGRYTVTFDEYDHYAHLAKIGRPSDNGWGRGRRPVINVSWHEAAAYAQWLAEQTGKAYRLPSEAEWEYAARAGTETAYWWGDEIGTNRANCAGSGSDEWSGKQTAPVDAFPPNPWGLHDTVGNVWEWVQDPWHRDYAGAPTDGSVWAQDGNDDRRVLRGGSWDDRRANARASFRNDYGPDFRGADIGFRLACVLPHAG